MAASRLNIVFKAAPPPRKNRQLRGVGAVSLLLGCKIVRVNLKPHKVQAGVVGRDPAAPAPQVGVQYLLPRMCKLGEDPGIQGHRFLGGVYADLFLFHVPLEHTRPAKPKQAGRTWKTGPRHFKVRKIAAAVFLVPHDPAGCVHPWQSAGKMVCPKNDLIF